MTCTFPLQFHSQKNKELCCNVWDVLQAQFGFGPSIDGPLLRRAGHTVLNIRGHRDTEDIMSHMSGQEVVEKTIEIDAVDDGPKKAVYIMEE